MNSAIDHQSLIRRKHSQTCSFPDLSAAMTNVLHSVQASASDGASSRTDTFLSSSSSLSLLSAVKTWRQPSMDRARREASNVDLLRTRGTEEGVS